MRAFVRALRGFVVTITVFGAGDASAQAPAALTPPVPDPRLVASRIEEPISTRWSDTAHTPRRRGRMVAAMIGSGVGLAAGVAAAAATGPHHCQCDDPGLKEAAIGYLVGSAIGAGIGAAIPKSDNPSCRGGARFGSGLLGGVLGAGAGGGIGLLTRSPLVLLTTPLGASYGASKLLSYC